MNHGKLSLDRSFVNGNTGSVGGGICNLHHATLKITGSTLSRNSGDGGGAIAAWYQGGSVELVDSVVADNKATYRGGGIDMDYGGRLSLVNTTVRNNTSASGGGIANY